MTYEEKIKDAIGCIKRHRRGLSDYNGDWSFFDTAIEALEKRMPKKPIFTEHILIKGCKPSEMRSCPNCKRFFDVTMIGDDFCKRCGQAIDWECR